MGMLKSRADDLERRLNQTKDALKESKERIEYFITDVKVLANDTEKVEEENIRLKKELEEQQKQHAKEMENAMKKK